MEIVPFLQRFEAEPFQSVSHNHLAMIQTLHLENIPFENLDVIHNVPIYLNLETMYSKIVENNRGGFCYELNGLLQHFLIELGYDCHLAAATVRRPTNEWARKHTHAAIIVHLDEPFLVDVGFGSATPKKPVPFSGEFVVDGLATYWLERADENYYNLIRKRNNNQRILYKVLIEKKQLTDFHEGIIFNQISKDSTFTHSEILSKNTPSGQVTFSNSTLRVTDGNVTEQHTIADHEKSYIFKHYFNINLSLLGV